MSTRKLALPRVSPRTEKTLFLFSLVPATALVIVGYFVLYSSARVEGGLRQFGKYLAGWIFFIAGVSLPGGLLASTIGLPGQMRGMAGMTQHMEEMTQHMERMETLEQQQLEVLRELRCD